LPGRSGDGQPRGVIREMSWRVDRDDDVRVLEAEDPAAAEAFLSTLPG
jgi:hypothetical protein